ncbi:hypothetical protein N7468_004789 [Penicillium chermesinum]|uniref:Cytochrome c oxidase assembly protein COX20, mitochondrial n=1 Tax=Penicillium chermesinum TaxID=63820 RepID=A0A9W9P971_9EURO|nr:uncharacterized protein N7468_004789 [Penicillium chermesinum]KAJ5240170.1 hypothetical protein N7468_004789 [Penicillium chermesinum]KAJ6167042.1 hypothetical protein N7470_002489 [Penicillium chermesinum]
MTENPLRPDSQEPGSHLPAAIPSTDPKKPKHELPQSQVGKLWEAFGNPEEPVNALANASYKPRGKDPKDISYSDITGTINISELSSVHRSPGSRDSLMIGIGSGFATGGLRAVFGGARSLGSAANWAAAGFVVSSIGAYEFFRRRRIEEARNVTQMVGMMKELKDKKQREKEKAEEMARLAEEDRRKKSWTNPSNYKFW